MRVIILTAARWRCEKQVLMIKIGFDHFSSLLSLLVIYYRI